MKKHLYFLLFILVIFVHSFSDAKAISTGERTTQLRENWKHLHYDLKDLIQTTEGSKLKNPQAFLSDTGNPNDQDLEYVFSLKKIVCRDIDIFAGGFFDFSWTQYFPKLEEIDLSCIPITSLKGIHTPEHIRKLGLGKLKHPEELLLLKKCKNLKTLRIIVDNTSINYLRNLKGLEELSIVYSLNLTTIKPIMKLDLKHLSFGDNNVPEKEIKQFKKLHKTCIVEY